MGLHVRLVHHFVHQFLFSKALKFLVFLFLFELFSASKESHLLKTFVFSEIFVRFWRPEVCERLSFLYTHPNSGFQVLRKLKNSMVTGGETDIETTIP